MKNISQIKILMHVKNYTTWCGIVTYTHRIFINKYTQRCTIPGCCKLKK